MKSVSHLVWLLMAVTTCAQAAAPAASADWPMFRGDPGLHGVSPEKLPAKPVLLWSFKTGGPVKSSPVVADGTVFVGSGDGNLYALGLADGKKTWDFKTTAPVDAPPLFVQGKIFVGNVDGILYAFTARDGKPLWKYKTDDKILGSANVIASSNGVLRLLVDSYDSRLHCVDAEPGKSNWVFETGNYINGSPAVAGGVTAFGGCDAILHVVSLDKGEKIKEVDAGAYIAASVALDNNRAYFGH